MPHTFTVAARSGTPRKPLAGLIATVTSSDVGSPPWQSAQAMPALPWALASHWSAISCCLLSIAEWQVAQVFVSAGTRLPAALGTADGEAAGPVEAVGLAVGLVAAGPGGLSTAEAVGLALPEGPGLAARTAGMVTRASAPRPPQMTAIRVARATRPRSRSRPLSVFIGLSSPGPRPSGRRGREA